MKKAQTFFVLFAITLWTGCFPSLKGRPLSASSIKNAVSAPYTPGKILWNGFLQLGLTTAGGSAAGDERAAGKTVTIGGSQSVAIDAAGNVFQLGYTDGNFGEANGGSFDVFVSKRNSNGALVLKKQLGVSLGAASSAFEQVDGLVIDTSGNLYICGSTMGALGEVSGGSSDAFVVKMNNDLVVQWIRQLGNVTIGAGASGPEYAYGIALTSTNDVVITGQTNGALGEANGGWSDVFIAKINGVSGVLSWVKQLGNVTMGAAASVDDRGMGIAINSSDEIFITGFTSGPLGEAHFGGAFVYDVFITKFSSAGTFAWVKHYGSVTGGASANGSDTPKSIVLDTSGNIYVAVDTDGSLGEAAAGGGDVAVMSWDNSGTFRWKRQLGNVTIGAGANSMEWAKGILIDSNGDINVTGTTWGAIGEPLLGGENAFVAKFNATTGAYLGAKQLGLLSGGGTAGGEEPTGIIMDGAGKIIISGTTANSVSEPLGGANDLFLWNVP